MSIKQKINRTIIGVFIAISALFFVGGPLTAFAASCPNDPTTGAPAANCCGGVQTTIISCTQDGTGSNVNNSGVWGLLLLAINILTAGVGVAAVGGIVYGSILYTSAGGSPDGVKKAREVITNVVIGIVAYALMYSILNFIIPGGLFHK
jgi:hypothetical protein